MYSSDEEQIDPNLKDWSIEETSSKGIKIKLNFEKPSEVGVGDEDDLLFIQVNLSAFKDSNDAGLPTSVIMFK